VSVPTTAAGLPVDMQRVDDTYGSISGPQDTSTAIVLPLLRLTDDEAALVDKLAAQVLAKRFRMELHNAYYEGSYRIADLGISVPPQMRTLRIALGWCRVGVDALDARLNLEGFRYPDSADVDADMMDLYASNLMSSESQMAHVDALVFGHGVAAVGTNEDTPDLPLITVESPLDFACRWDARTRTMTAALRLFGSQAARQATLYLPDETVSLEQTTGGWSVVDRDQHKLGEVLVERIVNRARSYDREGASEITPELMSITDAASRTLLGLSVAQEFYSAPQRYILGADEASFMGPDGQPKSGWETYMGRVLALERDADGNAPTVGQFTPYDPSTFTKVMDMYARHVSSITSLPPHVLGYTTDNPASADAIRSSEHSLVTKANRKTVAFGKGWANLMRKALLVRGQPPDDAHLIVPVWGETATPTIGATTDAIFKQVSMGYLPATSDVTGEVLGYSPAQRARIETDRATDQGQSFLNELAHSIGGKAARVDQSLAADIGGHAATAPVPGIAGVSPAVNAANAAKQAPPTARGQ
jgi:hypothetical protein